VNKYIKPVGVPTRQQLSAVLVNKYIKPVGVPTA
jgi:hypothetical protein